MTSPIIVVAGKQPKYIALSAHLAAIKAQRNDPFSKVDYLSEEAVRVLLREPAAATKLGLRDRMMLIFFYDTGARIQEVLNVRLCDLTLSAAPKVVLYGKGRKVRTVPLMKDTVLHLKQYMAVFHEGASAVSEQWLFYTERKGERKPICDDTVRLILYCVKANMMLLNLNASCSLSLGNSPIRKLICSSVIRLFSGTYQSASLTPPVYLPQTVSMG